MVNILRSMESRHSSSIPNFIKFIKSKVALMITVQILDLCFHAGVKFTISVAHSLLTEEMIHRR